MKTFALVALILLFATAAHAALYEVTIDGSKYQLSEDKEQEVTLTDGRRASVTVTTLGDLFWVRINGMKQLLPEGKTWEAALKDGGRVIVSVAPVKGDPKVFRGYGISFLYPSDVEITQESSPEVASVQFNHDGVTMILQILFAIAPTEENMNKNKRELVNLLYQSLSEAGARFLKKKNGRRSVGGVAIEGVVFSYLSGGFETLSEAYIVPHDGRILLIQIVTNNPERKAKHDSLINFVFDSLK